ncbi:hypothetical protein B0O99DRAFT_593284 [Bisporella sp. PMI_857]|nr:hypothetical protein B0O99DRAFT_593284 [Bisporella sp. PMI_857]
MTNTKVTSSLARGIRAVQESTRPICSPPNGIEPSTLRNYRPGKGSTVRSSGRYPGPLEYRVAGLHDSQVQRCVSTRDVEEHRPNGGLSISMESIYSPNHNTTVFHEANLASNREYRIEYTDGAESENGSASMDLESEDDKIGSESMGMNFGDYEASSQQPCHKSIPRGSTNRNNYGSLRRTLSRNGDLELI